MKDEIIHVDTASEWRGGQQQLFILATEMDKLGYSVKVACPKGSPLWKRLQGKVKTCAIPSGWSLRTPYLLSKLNPSLFAAHTSHAHGCCSVLSKPLVVHRRVDFVPNSPWKYDKADAFITVSDAVSKVMSEHVPSRKIFRVYDGVFPPPSHPPASDSPRVLAVGARVAHKGHHVLSQAAKLLSGVDIGIAGDGPLYFPNLRYLGYRNDIPALFAGADLFVHPSIEEGLGQVVIEAMMVGLPVIVSKAGGLPEVVGQAGCVVPPNDPVALANAIEESLQIGEHRSLIARKRAQKYFSVSTMVEESIKIYELVLQNSI